MTFTTRSVSGGRKSRFLRLVWSVGVGLLAVTTLLAAPQLGNVGSGIRDFFLPVDAADGVTNVLLLGNSGGGHDGATLVDSIMVASVNHRAKTVTLLSLPRDLYVDIPGEGEVRVNNAWKVGLAQKGKGLPALQFARDVVSGIIGQPIPYVARVDFDGFEKLIDLVGGVDVFVERSFTDSAYPGANWSYQTVSFRRGPAHLDGKKALQFARSRHAGGVEGSDFARAARQQKIIEGLRDKALSGDWLEKDTIRSMFEVASETVETNLSLREILGLASLGADFRDAEIRSFVLSSANGLLVAPSDEVRFARYGGAWPLLPAGGTFDGIHRFAQFIFGEPAAVREGATLQLLNASGREGLAGECKVALTRLGFTVSEIGNSLGGEALPESEIYDHTASLFPETMRVLPSLVGGSVVTAGRETAPTTADLTITLGEDAIPLCTGEEAEPGNS